MKAKELIGLGKRADELLGTTTLSVERALAKAGVVKRQGDGCECGNVKWMALLLAQDMLIFENGFSAGPAERDWEEFRGTSPERCTNKDSAFETWAQRGEGRKIKAVVTPQKRFGMGDPLDERVGDAIYSPECCTVELRKQPFVSEMKLSDCAHGTWGLTLEIGEWSPAVMVDGDVRFTEKPVIVSNWALPTVGERIVV